LLQESGADESSTEDEADFGYLMGMSVMKVGERGREKIEA